MIKMRIDHCTVEWTSAVDDHAVIRPFNVSPHASEVVNHNSNTVRFLDLEFLGIADNGGTFGKSSHDGNHRNLIDQCWDDASFDGRSFKGTGANQKIGSRFAFCTLVEESDISTHIHADL